MLMLWLFSFMQNTCTIYPLRSIMIKGKFWQILLLGRVEIKPTFSILEICLSEFFYFFKEIFYKNFGIYFLILCVCTYIYIYLYSESERNKHKIKKNISL